MDLLTNDLKIEILKYLNDREIEQMKNIKLLSKVIKPSSAIWKYMYFRKKEFLKKKRKIYKILENEMQEAIDHLSNAYNENINEILRLKIIITQLKNRLRALRFQVREKNFNV